MSLEVILLFLEGENAGSEIRIEAPKELLLGRSEECDVFIGEKKVSRKHAKLTVSEDKVWLEDLESTNGTFVDNKKINKVALKDGDTVRIGITVFKVTIVEVKALSREGHLEPQPKKHLASTIENKPAEMPVERKDLSADKAFDLLSEEIEVPDEDKEEGEAVSAPEAYAREKGHDRKKALTGDLSEMSLPDILQILKNNSRSGILTITRAGEKGRIYFIDGKLSSASIGPTAGLKAIYRMLSFSDGAFEFGPLPDDFSPEDIKDKIEISLENLLIEGMRHIDELEKIRKGLPSAHARLDINRGCQSPLSKLHPKVLDVLQLVVNHQDFAKVMDASPLSDLETGKIIFYLLKKDYIKAE